MSEIISLTPSVDAELLTLAKRYRAAGGVGMQVLNVIGGQAENLLERLPDKVKDRLEGATAQALETAFQAASHSRRVVPDQKPWLNVAMTTAMGAAGGAGGLPSALAELPVTTTVLLRIIQGVASSYGFDPQDEEVRKECLMVFSAAGPLRDDDGADMAFLAARVTLTGATLHGMITRIAPRLATVLGQKLATQTIPVIGAAAGAATNFAYTSYYQEIAHVHFGLLDLSQRSGLTQAVMTQKLQQALSKA
jgi:uncharacterized protein (DUF697 family)